MSKNRDRFSAEHVHLSQEAIESDSRRQHLPLPQRASEVGSRRAQRAQRVSWARLRFGLTAALLPPLLAQAAIAAAADPAGVTLRTRVQTDEGVFLVYDALIPPDNPRDAAGYLAYWYDFTDESLRYWGALVLTDGDLTRALIDLEEDMSIDLSAITALSPRLARLVDAAQRPLDPAHPDPAPPARAVDRSGTKGHRTGSEGVGQRPADSVESWRPLTMAGALATMGFDIGMIADGEDLPPPDEPPCTPEESVKPYGRSVRSDRASGITRGVPLPAPPAPTPVELVIQATAEIVCSPGGCQGCCSGCACSSDPCCGNSDPCCGVVCPPDTSCQSWGCSGGGCEAAIAIGACESDGNACTNDLCQGGYCAHMANTATCPDEGNLCTFDVCSNTVCMHPPMPGGTACPDDGNFCTSDFCMYGECIHPSSNENGVCPSDGNVCTLDICVNGICGLPWSGSACDDDGNPCTNDVCSAGACVHPNNTMGCADDGNPCTNDVCSAGACTHPANTAACDDDGSPCTLDVCSNGACTHPPGNDGAACADDRNPCTRDICSEGTCTHPSGNDGTFCWDDYPCTDGDACSGGSCVGTPHVCDDGIDCTADWCDPTTGDCGITPNDSACDNAVYCDGIETCDAHGCQPGTNPCAPQACNEATHGCYGCGTNADCDDGWFCNGSESCVGNACQSGPKPCAPNLLCDEETDQCVACLIGSDCDDGNACTVDACVNHWCDSTQPKYCSPHGPCTTVGCDPARGCEYTSVCDDGDPCTFDLCDESQPTTCGHVDIAERIDTCTDFGWGHSATPPAMLFVNDDDDNGNEVADYMDSGPVAGEDDLLLVPVSIGWGSVLAPYCLCEDTSEYYVGAVQSGGAFDTYLNPDQTGVAKWSGPGAGAVYVSGRRPTPACGAPLELMTVCCSRQHRCIATAEPIVVSAVESLVWEKDNPGNADLGTCPNNGGVQIFPDKLSPDDETPNIRRQVKLVATVAPPVPGVTVYFKVFDVDDPFNSLPAYSAMPNVSLIDGDSDGRDNRGTEAVALPWTATDVTDESGKATVTFTVSMQPGNNYRAGASVLSDAVAQATQWSADRINNWAPASPGDFSGYSVPLVWSQMLTVWRKLHVEFDSMTTEPGTTPEREPDWQSVYISSAVSGTTSTTLQLGWTPQGASNHQYEGGHILMNASALTYAVRDHTDGILEITPSLTPAQLVQVVDHWATLKDDDPDGGLLPHFYAVTPTTKGLFATVYVDPLNLDPSLNTRTTVPFDLYVSAAEMTTGQGWNNSHDVASDSSFWTSFVVAGYQAGGALDSGVNQWRDNDPDPLLDNATYPSGPYWPDGYEETWQRGWTSGFLDFDAIVFRASLAEYPLSPEYPSYVISHEIGHSAGNSGTEAQHHAEGGLMSTNESDWEHGLCPATIVRLREATKW